MKTRLGHHLMAALLGVAFTAHLPAQTSAFTYQGQLNDGGAPAYGSYDLSFALYDAPSAGTFLGGITNSATMVSNGLFTVQLDFGTGVFDGNERWLQLGVVTNGGGALATLSPRQPLTATPHAVHAVNAATATSAATVSGTVAASQLIGTLSSNNFEAGSITATMLANGAVGTAQLADDAVSAEKLSTPSDWFVTRPISNPTPETNDRFGTAVAGVGADKMIIGASGDNTAATSAGAAYLFSTTGTLLTTITDPLSGNHNGFGSAVAALGGDKVIIGAPLANTVDTDVGAAYLFTANGALLTTFTNPTPETSDYFGRAVAGVGADKVLVTASGDNTGATSAGAAYLFNTNGTLLATLNNPTPEYDGRFGHTAAALGNDKIIIGAIMDNSEASQAGAAYLFNTSGALLTTFTNPAPDSNDQFGSAVAGVGADRVLVGAYADTTAAGKVGAAYLFNTNGTLLTTFTNPTPDVLDFFGDSVAGVGPDKVIIGAWGDDTGDNEAGAAYLFSTNGLLLAAITNPTPVNDAYFGTAVAGLGADTVLIGASGDHMGASAAGAAYLFAERSYIPGLVALDVAPKSISSLDIADGTVGPAQLTEDVALLNSAQTFSGANAFTNAGNSFNGDGSGLTGISSLDASDGNPAQAVSVNSVGSVGIGTTSPTTRLTVSGAGAYNSSSAASIIVDNTAASQEWQWHVLDNGNMQWSDHTAGLTRLLIDTIGNVGIGTITPSTRLHVAASGDNPAAPEGHVALIRDTDSSHTSGLAIQSSYTGTHEATFDNFITFFNGSGTSIGSIEGNGSGSVQLGGAGSDFAEYLPKADSTGPVTVQSIVGVREGHIVRPGEAADQYMVATGQAIVAGNRPGESEMDLSQHTLISFIGQVPVQVRGPVRSGDFILASDSGDATGIALPAEAIQPSQMHRVVGRAWESSDEEGLKSINTAVGLDQTRLMVPALKRMDQSDRELRAANAQLKRQQSELESRIAALEKMLNRLTRDQLAAATGEAK